MPPPKFEAPTTATRTSRPHPRKFDSPEIRVDPLQETLDMTEDDDQIWRQHDMHELAEAFGLQLEDDDDTDMDSAYTLHARAHNHPHVVRQSSPSSNTQRYHALLRLLATAHLEEEAEEKMRARRGNGSHVRLWSLRKICSNRVTVSRILVLGEVVCARA
eukprot:CAMPEP_0173106342 /NCGR_PEP_ID=MMETSP1102-20130122/40893_1 /TAXON_ID=49646 /ORGANISM="Geminigera sp., Strain Caron Lab Isolate" /LENGTH=159 /DNA_ID=CAMNT_0014003259 /DNA_START=116 /DNA_END=596 /DNA_ORIENTATION=-